MAVLTKPLRPDLKVRLINSDGTMAAAWVDYFTRLDDYIASLEGRIEALEP